MESLALGVCASEASEEGGNRDGVTTVASSSSSSSAPIHLLTSAITVVTTGEAGAAGRTASAAVSEAAAAAGATVNSIASSGSTHMCSNVGAVVTTSTREQMPRSASGAKPFQKLPMKISRAGDENDDHLMSCRSLDAAVDAISGSPVGRQYELKAQMGSRLFNEGKGGARRVVREGGREREGKEGARDGVFEHLSDSAVSEIQEDAAEGGRREAKSAKGGAREAGSGGKEQHSRLPAAAATASSASPIPATSPMLAAFAEVAGAAGAAAAGAPSLATKGIATGKATASRVILRSGYQDIAERYAVHKDVMGSGRYGEVRQCMEKATGRVYACKSIKKELITVSHGPSRSISLLGMAQVWLACTP